MSSAVNMLTNSPKISDLTKADFFPAQFMSYSCPNRLMVVPWLFQQCLEPVNNFIPERCSEARPFTRLSTTSFGLNNFWNTYATRLVFFTILLFDEISETQ